MVAIEYTARLPGESSGAYRGRPLVSPRRSQVAAATPSSWHAAASPEPTALLSPQMPSRKTLLEAGPVPLLCARHGARWVWVTTLHAHALDHVFTPPYVHRAFLSTAACFLSFSRRQARARRRWCPGTRWSAVAGTRWSAVAGTRGPYARSRTSAVASAPSQASSLASSAGAASTAAPGAGAGSAAVAAGSAEAARAPATALAAGAAGSGTVFATW